MLRIYVVVAVSDGDLGWGTGTESTKACAAGLGLKESQARYSTRTGPSLTGMHAQPGTSRATLGATSAAPSP